MQVNVQRVLQQRGFQGRCYFCQIRVWVRAGQMSSGVQPFPQHLVLVIIVFWWFCTERAINFMPPSQRILLLYLQIFSWIIEPSYLWNNNTVLTYLLLIWTFILFPLLNTTHARCREEDPSCVPSTVLSTV